MLKADAVLDCTGLLCPIPVIRTNKAIREIQVGQLLELIATDPGSKPDMMAWTRQTGHELVQMQEEGRVYRFYLRRTH